MLSRLALVIIAVGLVSCGDSGTRPREEKLAINTEKDTYVVGQPIAVSITSTFYEAVNVATCCLDNPDIRIQRQVEADWTPPGVCTLRCVSYPLHLSSCDRIIDTLLIGDPGLYRLMLRYSTGSDNPRNDSAYSNEFQVFIE